MTDYIFLLYCYKGFLCRKYLYPAWPDVFEDNVGLSSISNKIHCAHNSCLHACSDEIAACHGSLPVVDEKHASARPSFDKRLLTKHSHNIIYLWGQGRQPQCDAYIYIKSISRVTQALRTTRFEQIDMEKQMAGCTTAHFLYLEKSCFEYPAVESGIFCRHVAYVPPVMFRCPT